MNLQYYKSIIYNYGLLQENPAIVEKITFSLQAYFHTKNLEK